ncbi:hypothetical protein [Pedobacter nutrimenti]|uniref:hypothetical protein n=1 Tax=Pedobacter nutrimenti TaxID=1241337 RepID=UPI00292D5893|nr:hypothetical protein [Pedobacter nutrimenti]
MKTLQTNLFRSIKELTHQPLIVAYGLGVDSTAVLVKLHQQGIRPDAILFADTGNEKKETYAYLPVINAWLQEVGFPPVTVVRYEPKDFKNYPPYATLGENCLTNGTLPSLAFGFKSCSLKWKVAPQNAWTNKWLMAVDYWKVGGKVLKIIGYDASPKDLKRYAHAKDLEDPLYQYWYPLIEWNMDRQACKAAIQSAGLPVPPKSACVFCPATQPHELLEFRKEYLRLIVIMEARAKPRLQGCMSAEQLQADFQNRHRLWQQKIESVTGPVSQKLIDQQPQLKSVGSGCAGLWRKATASRPAMMTDYIRTNGLLPLTEIDSLQQNAPIVIMKNQTAYAAAMDFVNWHDFLEMFSDEDALDELGCCANCAKK